MESFVGESPSDYYGHDVSFVGAVDSAPLFCTFAVGASGANTVYLQELTQAPVCYYEYDAGTRRF